MAVSAMYSAGTSNLLPFSVQVAKSGINTFGHYLDPKNESTVMQMAQLIANSGVAKIVGGTPWNIACGLGVDALNVYAAPNPSSKEESNLRGIGLACVKGVLTLDPVKFAENALGQVIADGSREFVPEEKESDGIGTRLIRSVVTSSDLHGVLVDSIVKDPPKSKPKEDTGQRVEVDPDSESQFPKQVLNESEVEGKKPKVQITREEDIKQPQQSNTEKDQALPKQGPTAEELQYQAEYDKWQLDSKQHTEKLTNANNEVIQKEAGVTNAKKYLEDKTKEFNKKNGFFNFAQKESNKLDNAQKNLKTAEGELEIAQKVVSDFKKVSISQPMKPTQTALSLRDRSHLLETPPQALPIHYQMDKDGNNDFRIYIYHEGKTPKAVGRFDSEGKALEAVTALNDHVRQINALNAESYNDQKRYEALGLNPNDIATTLQFDLIYPGINAPGDKSKAKVYLGDQRILKTDSNTEANSKFQGLLSGDIAAKSKALADYKAAMDAKAPSHIVPPTGNIQVPFESKGGKNHHLGYVDDSGKTQGLGKYPNADDSKLVAGGWSQFSIDKSSKENQCFEARKQLVDQGIPIDNIHPMPTFEVPIVEGKDAEKSYQNIVESKVRNAKIASDDLAKLEKLSNTPLNVGGISRSEVSRMTQEMMPHVKDPKQHGFWYDAWRAPRKGLRWLDDHGVSVNVNVNVSRPLYQTKASQSSYRDTQHQIMLERSHLSQIEQRDRESSSLGQWENFEAEQTQQMFDRNMAYQSPVDTPSQATLDYQKFWGQGVSPNAQTPPD